MKRFCILSILAAASCGGSVCRVPSGNSVAVANLARIDLEDLALAVENDLENVIGGHGARVLAW